MIIINIFLKLIFSSYCMLLQCCLSDNYNIFLVSCIAVVVPNRVQSSLLSLNPFFAFEIWCLDACS